MSTNISHFCKIVAPQARSQGGPMGPMPHHYQWFVPHHQALGSISIIDPTTNYYSWSWGMQHWYLCDLAHNHAKWSEFAQNHQILFNVFIVNDIFYTGPHCQIVCPIASNYPATGLVIDIVDSKRRYNHVLRLSLAYTRYGTARRGRDYRDTYIHVVYKPSTPFLFHSRLRRYPKVSSVGGRVS